MKDTGSGGPQSDGMISIDHPRHLSVDEADLRHPIFESGRRPLGPQILRLGQMSIDVDYLDVRSKSRSLHAFSHLRLLPTVARAGWCYIYSCDVTQRNA